jgi:hypothetical protein
MTPHPHNVTLCHREGNDTSLIGLGRANGACVAQLLPFPFRNGTTLKEHEPHCGSGACSVFVGGCVWGPGKQKTVHLWSTLTRLSRPGELHLTQVQ